MANNNNNTFPTNVSVAATFFSEDSYTANSTYTNATNTTEECSDAYEDAYDNDNLHLTVPAAAALTSKVTALFSLVGSYVILREIYNDSKDNSGLSSSNRNIVIPNLLISLSCADVLSSLCTILGTVMTPIELRDYVWGAHGTILTCEIQGFVVVLGYMASPLFNCALATTYLLLIRYKRRDQQLKPYQKYIHACLWGLSLFLAIIPLPLDWYNNGGDICWSAASPFYCTEEEGVDCERGGIYAIIYGATLFTLIPFGSFIVCGIILCLIWKSVRNMEDRASIYQSGWSTDGDDEESSDNDSIVDIHNDDIPRTDRPSEEAVDGPAAEAAPERPPSSQQQPASSTDRTKSQEMMKQGVFFILAFFITYFPAAISWVFEDTEAFGILLFLSYSVFLPLQGFWNCLVFIRQRKMKTWEGRIFRLSFFYWREDSAEANNRRRRSSPMPVQQVVTVVP